MITVEDMVRREVHYCVSFLVSTLAQGYGLAIPSQTAGDLAEATEQAFELCSPIDDWEEAAIQEGWTRNVSRMAGTVTYTKRGLEGHYMPEGWQDLCEAEGIDPYQREVYEHWIVSDWLADQLAARGEKVDKDFAGMTVWARTTTGQGIASDSVIVAIHAALVGASEESV